MNGLRAITDFVLKLIYPPRCISCGELLPITEKLAICKDCEEDFSVWKVSSSATSALSMSNLTCSKVTDNADSVVSAFYYDGNVKAVVLRYKQSRSSFAKAMAEQMYEALEANGFGNELGYDAVICIPSSRRKMRKRGYNPAELLAKHISRLTEISYVKNALKQKGKKSDQKSLGAEERAANIKGKFLPGKYDVSEKRILLVDDVITTGATVNEAAGLLKANGAGYVCVLSYARTL